jgi:flavin-binding protein dodecin
MTLMGGDRAGDQVVASAFAFQIVADNSRSDDPGMSDHVYKKIELVGSSPNSIEDAVANAIARAGQTVRNMRWFEVTETRGHLEEGKIGHWQVTVKVGFTLD